MRRLALAALLALAGCAHPSPKETPAAASDSSADAPTAAPAGPAIPARGDGPALPATDTVITRIAVGCCPEPGLPYQSWPR
jgi:hypothetical protein